MQSVKVFEVMGQYMTKISTLVKEGLWNVPNGLQSGLRLNFFWFFAFGSTIQLILQVKNIYIPEWVRFNLARTITHVNVMNFSAMLTITIMLIGQNEMYCIQYK